MKSSIITALLLSWSITNAQQLNSRLAISTAADKIENKVIDWRRDIHQHPELGNRETRTAGLVAKHLKSLGLDVKTNVALTGVVGILKGDKPGVDVIFGLHNNAQLEVGKISYRPGGMFASVGDMKIVVKGKPSHGAEPWSSVDPIVVSAQIINNLQSIVSRNVNITENAAVVTIGSIHGGNRSNIIPNEVEMLGTVRTFTKADEALVFARIRQVVEKTAESAGAIATLELPYSSHYPVTFNNVELTSAMLPSLQKSAGKDNVILVPAETGAEDFSFFAQKVPGLFFYIGGLPKGKDPKTSAPHHTPGFFIDESGFKTGLNALVNLVVDYMEMNSK